MRTLVVGDIHGNYKGFEQCLNKCNFDNDNDTLISLGDLVDGHSESKKVVDKLLSIKNIIAIKGNHDDWFNDFLQSDMIKAPAYWVNQGGKATLESYGGSIQLAGMKHYGVTNIDIPESHIEFFNTQLPYYIDDNKNLFIHGGFNRHSKLVDQLEHIFWWDRDLWSQALCWKSMSKGMLDNKPPFKIKDDLNEIFIGHTSTQFWDETTPMNAANIWNMDTGGGWYGYITIMDINTKEYWQSDKAKELYPNFNGR